MSSSGFWFCGKKSSIDLQGAFNWNVNSADLKAALDRLEGGEEKACVRSGTFSFGVGWMSFRAHLVLSKKGGNADELSLFVRLTSPLRPAGTADTIVIFMGMGVRPYPTNTHSGDFRWTLSPGCSSDRYTTTLLEASLSHDQYKMLRPGLAIQTIQCKTSILLRLSGISPRKELLPVALASEEAQLDVRKSLWTAAQGGEGAQLCDVQLLSGGRSFPAHRNVLAAASPVFAAMLTDKDKYREGREGKITVDDLAPETLDKFLRFLYTGDCDTDDAEEVGLLLTAGDKYDVRALVAKCKEVLWKLLEDKALPEILALSEQNNHAAGEAMKREVLAYVENNFKRK